MKKLIALLMMVASTALAQYVPPAASGSDSRVFGSGTFSIGTGKTFTSSNTLTLTGTDGSLLNINNVFLATGTLPGSQVSGTVPAATTSGSTSGTFSPQQITGGAATISSTNQFSQYQTSPGQVMLTGSIQNISCIGTSRTGGGIAATSISTATNLTTNIFGVNTPAGFAAVWPAMLANMGYCANDMVVNYGAPGWGIENILQTYSGNGSFTTTGVVTAGSGTIVVTGGTSGIIAGLNIAGPGIPFGQQVKTFASGTLVLNNPNNSNSFPLPTSSGTVTLNLCPNLGWTSMGGNGFYGGGIIQNSTTVTGSTSLATLEVGINDTVDLAINFNTTAGSGTLTGGATAFMNCVVGYTVTGTGLTT
jgi:hypothetical protein